MQDTPTDRERAGVLEQMAQLGQFEVAGPGFIIIADPAKVEWRVSAGLSGEKAEVYQTALRDFGGELQFLADWMRKRNSFS